MQSKFTFLLAESELVGAESNEVMNKKELSFSLRDETNEGGSD